MKKLTNCLKCFKEFLYYPCSSAGKYCSKICDGSHNQQITRNCLLCNNEYKRKPSKKDAKYCSKICTLKAHDNKSDIILTDKQILDSLKRRYEKFVIKNQNSCWDWSGTKKKRGYGELGYSRNKNIKAHRASWLLHRGEIPNGLWVLHNCDNPPCTNPDHLYLGNVIDNARDMITRKRQYRACNDNHPRALLTNDQVLKIKELLAASMLTKDIAQIFNVRPHVISGIKNNKSYKTI